MPFASDRRNNTKTALRATLWAIVAGLLLTNASPVLAGELTASDQDAGEQSAGDQSAGKQRAAEGIAGQNPLSAVTSLVAGPFASLTEGLRNLEWGQLKRPTTVLFMGTDVVYHEQQNYLWADRASCNGKSDTMLLVFLNPEHKKAAVLQIPRDTQAFLRDHGLHKINAANKYGGPELAKSAVTSLLNVAIDHYVVMNIDGLMELVDELGGITVQIPKKVSYNVCYVQRFKIDLNPGPHTLNGNQAMGFVRFRPHDGLGDIGRVQRQQVFMQAVLQKMLNPSSWLHVPALLQIAQRNVRTDMTSVDIFEALNFVHSISKEEIKFVMLPGQFGKNGNWITGTDARVLAAQLLHPQNCARSSRNGIKVCVVNASSDASFGRKVAQALKKLGYIATAGKPDRDAARHGSRIIAQDGNDANAKMFQQDLGNVGEVINASVGDLYSSITLIAGDDIKLSRIKMSSDAAPQVVSSTATVH